MNILKTKIRIKLNNLPEILFYLFIFLLPWQTRWIFRDSYILGEPFEYGRMSLYGFDVVFILLFIIFVLRYFFEQQESRSKKQEARSKVIESSQTSVVCRLLSVVSRQLFVVCCLLSVVCCLSILWSQEKLISLYWSFRILQGLILFLLIQKINFDQAKVALAFVVSMSLSAVLGIYQFLAQSAFAFKWLGLAYHSARQLGASVVEFGLERWLRAYGSFPHPNMLAGFLVVAIILCWWLYNKSLKHENIKTLKHKIFYFLLVTALFFSFSRAGWMAFGLTMISCIVISFFPRHPERSPAEQDGVEGSPANAGRHDAHDILPLPLAQNQDNNFIFRLSIYGLILFVTLSIIYFPLAKTRITASERLEIKSNVERIASYNESFKIIKDKWLLGTGIGNYTYELQRAEEKSQPAWYFQPVHNTYLLVLSELGLVGFCLFILMLVSVIMRLLRIKNQEVRSKEIQNSQSSVVCRQLSVFYFLFFIFYFLFFFDHYFWTLASGMLLWWVVLGVSFKE